MDSLGAWDSRRAPRPSDPHGPRRRPGAPHGRPVRRRAASRRAGPASCCRSRSCCCWTSRPTTSTPTWSIGWRAVLRGFGGAVVMVTHDRYFLDRERASSGRSTAPTCASSRANFAYYLEKKPRSRPTSPRKRTGGSISSGANWTGCVTAPRPARPRPRRRKDAAHARMKASFERRTERLELATAPGAWAKRSSSWRA